MCLNHEEQKTNVKGFLKVNLEILNELSNYIYLGHPIRGLNVNS